MDNFFKRFAFIFAGFILSICLLGIVLNCSGCISVASPAVPKDTSSQQVNYNTSNQVLNNKEAQ